MTVSDEIEPAHNLDALRSSCEIANPSELDRAPVTSTRRRSYERWPSMRTGTCISLCCLARWRRTASSLAVLIGSPICDGALPFVPAGWAGD
jgi:hypothetical protein